jgi:hypothetical protein
VTSIARSVSGMAATSAGSATIAARARTRPTARRCRQHRSRRARRRIASSPARACGDSVCAAGDSGCAQVSTWRDGRQRHWRTVLRQQHHAQVWHRQRRHVHRRRRVLHCGQGHDVSDDQAVHGGTHVRLFVCMHACACVLTTVRLRRCVSGVCCDSACTGECVTCVTPGSAGTRASSLLCACVIVCAADTIVGTCMPNPGVTCNSVQVTCGSYLAGYTNNSCYAFSGRSDPAKAVCSSAGVCDNR